jgi:hypothetical protein
MGWQVSRTGVGKLVTKTASDIGRAKIARQISKAAQSVVKDVGKVGKAVPMLGTIAKLAYTEAEDINVGVRTKHVEVPGARVFRNHFLADCDTSGGVCERAGHVLTRGKRYVGRGAGTRSLAGGNAAGVACRPNRRGRTGCARAGTPAP